MHSMPRGGALNKPTFNLKILFTSSLSDIDRPTGLTVHLSGGSRSWQAWVLRVATNVKYLAATRLDQQTSPID